MPDKKISDLLSAGSLDGLEVLPLVQGAATKKATTKDVAKFGYQDVVTEATAARTLSLSDRGSYIRFTNTLPIVLTVPANSTAAFGIGESLNGIQAAAGQITITGAGGVTINKPADCYAKTRVSGSPWCLVKVASDTWDLIGDLEAIPV